MKRKLNAEDAPAEQFQALRQIRGLSQADCRRVIALLRDDEQGQATCRAQHLKYPEAGALLREVTLQESKLVVYVNTLPDLIQEKTNRCALFAHMLAEAIRTNGNMLTLLIFLTKRTQGTYWRRVIRAKATWCTSPSGNFHCFMSKVCGCHCP